jgi:endonuclease/exonuclease/phosphatase family metal-dependent hydrolase
MTWNVENLFGPGGPAGVIDPVLHAEKLSNLAATVLAHRPDVVAVQEIGSPAAFDELAARLGRSYPHRVLSSYPDTRGIRVGFICARGRRPADIAELSAFPPGALRAVGQPTGELTAMGRGALAITVIVDGERVRVVTCHWKSKLVTYPGGRFHPASESERAQWSAWATIRRVAEAAACRVWAVEMLARVPLVVVAGDLNDTPDAATTQLLTGPADRDLERADKGDPVRLVSLAPWLPVDRAYSRVYQARAELIDHIFVSTPLARRDVTIEALVDHIEPISDQPSRRRDAVWPDHAPVVATIS